MLKDTEFRKQGLGYALELTELGTTFEVSGLRRSGGDVHGELVIRSRWTGAKTVLDGTIFAPASVNLSSVQTRRSIAKLIDERVPTGGEVKPLDWHGFLEEFFGKVLQAEAEGEPVMPVGRRPVRIGDTELLSPMLLRNKTTILFGDGGTGKSLTAAAMALSVQTLLPIIPPFQPRVQAKVLYLDWETDIDDMDGRVKAICAGARMEPVEFDYRYCSRKLADMTEPIAKYVRTHDIGLLIVDSVGLACGVSGDNADPADAALRLFTAIRAIGVTTLCIDHVSKAGANNNSGSYKPYGSSYKAYLARSTWEIRQAGSTGEDELHLAFYQRKANTTAKHAAIGLALHFEPGAVWWASEDITHEDLTASLPLADRLAALLKHVDQMTTRELADATESTESSVRSTLNRHLDRFQSERRGSWRLISGTGA